MRTKVPPNKSKPKEVLTTEPDWQTFSPDDFELTAGVVYPITLTKSVNFLPV
jgi:hypothetical protein